MKKTFKWEVFAAFYLRYKYKMAKRVFIRFLNNNFVFCKVLASSAKNLLIVNFGLSVSFSTILLSALMGLNRERNPDEYLTITTSQSTWMGKNLRLLSKFNA